MVLECLVSVAVVAFACTAVSSFAAVVEIEEFDVVNSVEAVLLHLAGCCLELLG